MPEEVGRIHIVDVEAGATVPPEGHELYARDTDKLYKSDGSTLTELASSGGAYTDEQAQDAVGSIFTDTATIGLTYADATPEITADVKDDSIVFGKMQNIATDSLIGRDTVGSGDPENILLNSTMSMDGAGNLQRAALTGDVTASAGSNSTTIANDAVTYAKIQNVTDARLIGRSAGSSGDAQEITVGSGLSLLSGSLNLQTWNNQYDPNRPPASVGTGGVQDEFIGGVTITFNGWGNQESSTVTAEKDGLTLTHPADSTGVAVYWFTGPAGSSGDWFFHSRVTGSFAASTNQAGIAVLAAGTEGTPTLIYENLIFNSGATSPRAGARSMTSYTSAQTAVGTDYLITPAAFLGIGYVSSTKVMTFYHSMDGYAYLATGSATLGAHPTTSFGLEISSLNVSNPSTAFFHFVRVRTDADMLLAGS